MNFPRPLSSPTELWTPPSPPSASHPSLETTFSPSHRHPLPSLTSQTLTPFLSKGREGQSSDQGVSPCYSTSCTLPDLLLPVTCLYGLHSPCSRQKTTQEPEQPPLGSLGLEHNIGVQHTSVTPLAQLLTDPCPSLLGVLTEREWWELSGRGQSLAV